MNPVTNNAFDLGNSSAKWKDLYLSGKIYTTDSFQIMDANNAAAVNISTSNVRIGKNLLPIINSNVNLGSSTAGYAWKDLYLSGNIDFGNGATITKDSSNRINLCHNSIATFVLGGSGGYGYVKYNFCPDGTVDLGRSSAKWQDLYLSRNLTDGTNSIKVADIGKKLYQHNISSTGADFTGASLIIITTSATPLTSVLNVDLLLNGTSVVSAFIIDLNGLYTPIIKYGWNGLTALDFNFVDVSGGALTLGTKTLSDGDTITDTVTAL